MIDLIDRQLIECLQKGLPLVSRPYALIGQALDIDEEEVLGRLSRLKQQGLIKRIGVVVKHRRLGYQANAMVVFDVPDQRVAQIAGHVSQLGFVNLCYQRPRRGELWPYNLYCMIHGKNRDKVLSQLSYLIKSCGLAPFDRDVLFSKQCFKQRGAMYTISTQENECSHG